MTRVLRTRDELREALAASPRPVGLIPTMGWLHDGHRSLMRRAARVRRDPVVSIFVNPSQFDDPSDYTRYPRGTDSDLAICEAEGVDLVWAASGRRGLPTRLRHDGQVGAIAEPLEGAARPGHFDGVATVVAILFALIGAEHAYFGQKDAQQVMVIERMAADLALPDAGRRAARPCESRTAWRSRRATSHLSPEERRAAPVLHRALLAAREAWVAGERDARTPAARSSATSWRASRWPTSSTSRAPTRAPWRELDRVEGPALLSLAVRFGRTRLIDNESLDDGRRTARPSADRHGVRIDARSSPRRRGRAGRSPLRTSVAERATRRIAASRRRMPVDPLQQPVDVEVVGDEALDLVDLRRVGGVGLDQQVVDRCCATVYVSCGTR